MIKWNSTRQNIFNIKNTCNNSQSRLNTSIRVDSPRVFRIILPHVNDSIINIYCQYWIYWFRYSGVGRDTHESFSVCPSGIDFFQNRRRFIITGFHVFRIVMIILDNDRLFHIRVMLFCVDRLFHVWLVVLFCTHGLFHISAMMLFLHRQFYSWRYSTHIDYFTTTLSSSDLLRCYTCWLYFFYIRAAGRRARSARRPAVQNVSVIAQGHGGGHASPIEAAGQWLY